jgi:hypothetical protein
MQVGILNADGASFKVKTIEPASEMLMVEAV